MAANFVAAFDISKKLDQNGQDFNTSYDFLCGFVRWAKFSNLIPFGTEPPKMCIQTPQAILVLHQASINTFGSSYQCTWYYILIIIARTLILRKAFPIPLQAALPLMFNCRMDQFLIHYINYPFSNSPRGIVL